MPENASRDQNSVPVTLFQIDGEARGNLMMGRIDSATGRILVDSANAGITVLSPTGTVNSVNTSFVFSSQPTVIVNDGVTLRVNFGWTWNSGTLTATMSIPPSFDLFGIV